MTFASPALLWSLLALAPLIAAYLLKVRPRKRTTTAFFLWEQVLTDRKPNRLWDQLRNVISLLIMAAAFAAIALAMAGPRLAAETPSDLLIVIDNSLSMQADEQGVSRLDRAKERARDLARAMNGVQRAAVATLGEKLRYVSHLSDNPRELLAAIDRVTPTYETLNPTALPSRTDAQDAEAEEEKESEDAPATRRVLFLTDHANDETPEHVEPIVIASAASNLGLVGADLRFAIGEPNRLRFYYQVASSHDGPVETDLLLYHEPEDGPRRLAKVIPLEVAPGVNSPQVLSVDNAEPGRWVAELDTDKLTDALAADNRAYLVAYRDPPIRVRVESSEPYFLERAVAAFADPGGGLLPVEQDEEVTLAFGPTSKAASRAIYFAPDGESPWWSEVGEAIDVFAPKTLVDKHPLLRDIDPLSVSYRGAKQITPPAGSEVLVTSEAGTPLMYVAKRSGESALVVNLDPVEAEFYYSAWFPVLVQAAAKHLSGREAPLAATRPPRSPFVLPTSDEDFAAKLVGPQGGSTELNSPRVAGLNTPGFYRLESDTTLDIGCSTLAASESLVPTSEIEEEPEGLATGRPLGHWFAVAALLAATTESLLYHRRKVG